MLVQARGATMTRMTVTLDSALLEQARKALGAPTKSETIRIALMEVVRKRQLADALDHRGQIDLELDQEALQKLRASH
jgi:Arc/MetJ family transcription regulator